MLTPKRILRKWSFSDICLALAYLLQVMILFIAMYPLLGCGVDLADETSPNFDPFPNPKGPSLMRLEFNEQWDFNFVRLDSNQAVQDRFETLTLNIKPDSSNQFLYRYEGDNSGLILQHLQDSIPGIYLVGVTDQNDSQLTRSPVTPQLWLPDRPDEVKHWTYAGADYEFLKGDSVIFTNGNYYDNIEGSLGSGGFKKWTCVSLKETRSDTVTAYHFARGIGLVRTERLIQGKLQALAEIKQYQRRYYE